MNSCKLVFAQVMSQPLTTFRRCVARYNEEHKVKHFTCLDQFLCMAFAQLTYRESLRDIEPRRICASLDDTRCQDRTSGIICDQLVR